LKDDIVTTRPAARKPAKRRVAQRKAKVVAVAKPAIPAYEPREIAEAPPRAPPPVIERPEQPKPAAAEGPAPARKLTIPAPAPKAPPAAEPPLPTVDDPAAVAEMLAEGQALFEEGKVVQARRRFVAAMNGPVPEVLLALARSYDTYYLSRLPTADGAPDMQRALVLYERALERGAKEAAPDLERTRDVLKIPR
jgi:hypothetical protein